MSKQDIKNERPVELSEDELGQAQGGLIGLLLPAVQKVREAAATPAGGVNVALGDGSVRFVSDGNG